MSFIEIYNKEKKRANEEKSRQLVELEELFEGHRANDVMIKAMDNLLEKRANTDEFNRMYYNSEQTDKTLNFVEKIEELFVLIRENREYQANILCQKKVAMRDNPENPEIDRKAVELYANLQEEMVKHIKDLKSYTRIMENDIAW